MFFFRLKMSAMVDAIAMVCMFVASSIALECGDSLFVHGSSNRAGGYFPPLEDEERGGRDSQKRG